MSRLRHPSSAFLRTIQMRRAQLHVYVEGKQPDVYLYEKVVSGICESPWQYVIITPKELPVGFDGDGKSCLLKWYATLRKRKMLLATFKGHTAASLFVLDKDVDDLMRRRCRTAHVVYTRHYEVENHCFESGDLEDALAVQLGVSRSRIRRVIGDQSDWRRSAATRWREWVVVCLAAIAARAHKFGGYASPSRVNSPMNGDVDEKLLLTEMGRLEAAATSDRGAAAAVVWARRTVARLYGGDAFDRVFKGKWYAALLALDLEAAGLINPHMKGSLRRNVVLHLAQSLPVDGKWCEFLAVAVRAQTAAVGVSPRLDGLTLSDQG
jgi:hypothetical protein